MEIWRERVLWRVYVHPHTHPHTQLKKSGIPHTHTQSMRGFPVKTGTGSDNTTGTGLFAISNQEPKAHVRKMQIKDDQHVRPH